MAEFNWVKARLECSIKAVFKKLETGARADVDAITEIVQQDPKAQDKFEVSAFPDRFTVIRTKLGGMLSVEFRNTGSEIIAGVGDDVIVKAVPTLNSEGKCMLLMRDKEVELWEFRRAALENLLFRNL